MNSSPYKFLKITSVNLKIGEKQTAKEKNHWGTHRKAENEKRGFIAYSRRLSIVIIKNTERNRDNR
jgi:hypothetical protein